jgi:serine/threonine protein kinase
VPLPSGRPRSHTLAGPERRPRLLGHYHVLDELGHNAVGPLYLARLEGPRGFQRWAAIRRVNRVHLTEPGYVQRFYERVREGAKLLHPNVTALFDVDEDEGAPWVAMEYLHGARVEDAIERLEMADTPISWEIASRIIADAAEGLHAVHSLRDKDNTPLGLLHGDLAPHSVVITYEGKTKIKGAFEPRAHGVLDPRKTPYAAPEQLFDGVVDARADVFALGVLLWELLTGKRLFWRKTDDETRAMIEAGVVPPLGELVADVPNELDALVRRALVRNPTHRFPSARELSRELEGLLVAKGMVARDDDVGRYMRTLFADRYVEQESRLQAAADTTEVFRKSRSKLPKSSPVAALPDLSHTQDDEHEPDEETELMRSPIAQDDEDRTTAERPIVAVAPLAAPTERELGPPEGISGYTDELPADSGPTLPKRPALKLGDSDEIPTVTQTIPLERSRVSAPPPPPPSRRPPPQDEPTLTAPAPTPASVGRPLIMPDKIAGDADITESAIFVAPRLPSSTSSPEPHALPPRPTTPSFPDRPLLPVTPPAGVGVAAQRGGSPLQLPPTAPRPLHPQSQAPPPYVPNAFATGRERTTSRGPHAALTTGPLRAVFPQDRSKRVAIVSVVGFAGGALLFVLFFVVWRFASSAPAVARPAPTAPHTATALPKPTVASPTPSQEQPAPTQTATTAPATPPPTIATIDLTRRPVTPHHHVTAHPPPAPTPASGKTGFLTVMCKPVACDHVLDGGHDLGGTPFFRHELPAGKHRLVLRVENPHAEKVVSVDVPEGDTVTIRPDVE